ncbi:porin family protein [Larkinella rosea]|uniref:PorT family protein n=1 Tax=Larkinella rosea TaxID=2025312 RepID=A0A3P1BIU5_9BACT|nr:porin family protein [Larkinella rosea]RRB01047.1 PorT family protein [Larkinella rosea]
MQISTTVFSIFSFFLFSFPLFAQKSVAPGYILIQSTDTIPGFIDDKNWNKNPVQIQFKKRLEDELQTYTANQLKAFGITGGERYESHAVLIDKSPTIIADMVESTANSTVEDTVFLTVYVKGLLSLYYLKDEMEKIHFFVQRGNQSPQELILKRAIVEKQGTRVLATEEKYKTQLEDYLADCPQLKASIQKTAYTPQSMQRLISRYYQCRINETITYQVAPEKFRLSLNALAGVSHTGLKFTGKMPVSLTTPKFSQSTNVTFGVGFDLDLPRNHDKWAIYNELRWRSYQATANYEEVESSERYTKSSISFDLNYVSLVTMFRYRFGLAGLRAFVNAGIVNSLNVRAKNNKTVESRLFSTTTIEHVKAIDDFRAYEQGLAIGFGLAWKRFTGELRYELSNGMSAYTELRSGVKTASFLVAYRLNQGGFSKN